MKKYCLLWILLSSGAYSVSEECPPQNLIREQHVTLVCSDKAGLCVPPFTPP